MTRLENSQSSGLSYPVDFLHNLSKSKLPSNCESSTVLLCSGKQNISVQSVLLRKASNFLRDILPSPCSCSSNENVIVLPHTLSPTLASLVQMIHEGVIPSVSNRVAKDVMLLAKVLGIRNMSETVINNSSTASDLDLSVEFVMNKSDHSESDDDESDSGEEHANGFLKVVTSINHSDKSVNLKFPKSRQGRDSHNNSIKQVQQKGFRGRIQTEYNQHPVGKYMGPYDQNKKLRLSAQLPKSKLDFKAYSEFSHDGNKCFAYKIEQYDDLGELQKIDSYKIESEIDSSEDKSIDVDSEIYYTCQHRLCRIPCPCSHCCSDTAVQCTEHKMCHPALFDEDLHAVSIRSSDAFCIDESFFERSYIIRYPGIPLKCKKCRKDLLNHHCYHLEYHTNCRFCNPTFFKAKANTEEELKFLIKDEVEYFKTVCHYCDKRFCQAYFAKKHIETEHGEKTFKCDRCSKRFQSDKAKSYHEKTIHDAVKYVTCSICNQHFKTEVHLKEHQKYVHSDQRKFSCPDCDSKFKQKRDLRVHMLNIHNENYTKEDYQEKSNAVNEYKCDKCESKFKYKKNLNAHVKNKHVNKEVFHCDECESSFGNKKSLVRHKKSKHGPNISKFPCPMCGKLFLEKRYMKKHEKSHDAETDDD
jgi:uncharacterized C2H2 Zn-finger protein